MPRTKPLIFGKILEEISDYGMTESYYRTLDYATKLRKEVVKSIVKFENIEKSKSKNIQNENADSFLELIAINLLKNNENYEIILLFSNNGIITLTAEIVEVVLEDQNIKND